MLILREADAVQKRYPNSFVLDATTHSKLSYIELKAADAATARRVLDGFLRPISGAGGARLMRAEVPQNFYTLIMDGANPSAERGDLLPVDSVAHVEAEEFCKRLGWLTGLRVRLPLEKEFRLALAAGGPPAAQASSAWAFENAGGRAHEVATSPANAAGFHDLLGNVAEWTGDGSHLDVDAVEFGGNYQNNRDTLASTPANRVPRREKSRLRGFRVLVEDTPDSAAGATDATGAK